MEPIDGITNHRDAQRQLIDQLGEVDPKHLLTTLKGWSADDLQHAGTGLIQFHQGLDILKLDLLKALAKVVVVLRQRYRTPEGDIDWAGRSWDYRQTVGQMYEKAGIPPDSQSNIQASLRYHVGNLLREVAPAPQLEAVGLKTSSPKERMTEAKSTEDGLRRLLRDVRRATEGDSTTESEIVSIDGWMTTLYFTSRRLERADFGVFTDRVRGQHKELLAEIQAILETVEKSI